MTRIDEKFSAFVCELRSLNNEAQDVSFHYGVTLESVDSMFQSLTEMWNILREIEDDLNPIIDGEEVKEEEGE